MKKYTNKVLITGIALLLAAATILFFIKTYEVKKAIKHSDTKELNINQ
ncbi:MAG: hypothetical protein FWC34_06565 [Bacteroidetes bacterium]|nr:hypothetical protein [Bacteroidota bacterium]MCL2301735.1 hypothetical protein [Lentimicrobiaceae bacterium]